tara:strand:- start:184 stop:2544 length:2361 start_codon:yes stop_codon:yes gene_type:complete
MFRILCTISAFISLLGCNNTGYTEHSIEEYVPNNSEIVISINSLDNFKDATSNNELASITNLLNPLKKILTPLDSIYSKSPLLVCVTKKTDNQSSKSDQDYIYTFITHLRNLKADQKLSIPSITIDSVLIASQSEALLNLIKSQEISSYSKLHKRRDINATFSLYSKRSTKSINLSSIGLENLGNIFLDFSVSPVSVTINGTTVDEKSINHWFNIFENIKPQPQSLQNIFPPQTKRAIVYGYDDFNQMQRNLQDIGCDIKSNEFADAFFNTTKEIGVFETGLGSGIALKSIDISSTYETLKEYQNEINTFRSIPIFEFTETSLFDENFESITQGIKPTKFIALEDYLVFSSSSEVLKMTISNYFNKNSLGSSLTYKTLQKSLSSQASVNHYFNNNQLAEFFNSVFKTSIKGSELINYKLTGVQLVKDDNIVHLNSILQKSIPKNSKTLVSEEFNLTFTDDIQMGPMFVSNHINKGKDILLQDKKNILYLISNKGVILWKKALKNAILGKVEQADLYKNGRLQLVFSTKNRLYVIDRNGKNVGKFPLDFRDEITQPVAVFDYDKKRNYRFLITQHSNLLMYDSNKKMVKGFKYKPSKQIISKQPIHVRYQGKDFIVIAAGNQLKLLDRRGNIRVKVKESIDFSNESIYFCKSFFTTTNTKGELIQVNTKGNLTRQSLDLESNHDITTSSKTLVIRNENKLSINMNNVDLEYGKYSPPSLFYLNDKIYVSTTDLEAKKIWIFDSKAKPYPSIPVYGTSGIDLTNADNDSSLEFVTRGDAKSIILYQMY